MKSPTNKKIFIVDNDPFWRATLTQLLNELGYTKIFFFENGTSCVDNLQLNPGLIFLDYQLEDLDGLTVLQKIKAYFPGMGVVFCIARQDLGIAINAMKYGSFDYLLKENASEIEVTSIVNNLSQKEIFADKIY